MTNTRAIRGLIALLLLAGLWAVTPAPAQTGICAKVKIEILQQLTFERIAFDAELIVTNNLADRTLENFNVTLDIRDIDGDDVSDQFFVNVTDLTNISSVTGNGSIGPNVRSEIHWLIIPSPGAGGTDRRGQKYWVGGTVSFTVDGVETVLSLFPDTITVLPQPLLTVDYFLPRDVTADDPFTSPVEAPVPFTLGVRVSNDGYGSAGNLKISSGQPKIVENEQGLLIAFKLLGAFVNGAPVSPTLTPEFGTIPSMGCAVGGWQMITTLSGQFIEFDADYTHAAELGGELTSLIQEANAYRLVREMLVDLPARDTIPDFLADIDEDPEEFIPDTIFESNCGELPVNHAMATTTGQPTAGDPTAQLDSDVLSGWSFIRVDDPAQGLVPLDQVIRSDGKELHPRNFWVTRVVDQFNRTVFHHFVNIIDFNTTGSYELIYEPLPADTTPPVTTPQIGLPSRGTDPVYITPDTQIFFTSVDDISGVQSIVFQLDDDLPLPAFPFNIPEIGPHTILYHSTDFAGNREADKVLNVVVDDDLPGIDPLVPVPAMFTPGAPDGIPADRMTQFSLFATDTSPELRALIEIAMGTGADFSALPLVRSFEIGLPSSTATPVIWNGRNEAGLVVAEGTYTIRATVDDFLGHASAVTTTVVVEDYLSQPEVDPVADADQQHPDLKGDLLVWQDNRNDNWDIVALTISTGNAVNLTAAELSDQERPTTDGRYIVWQDRRDGNWDIFVHDTSDSSTVPLTNEVVDQERPVVSDPWVVWQEKNGAVYDIVAENLDTAERIVVSAGDTGTHDQLHPAIDGTTVAWEDYRFGLAEIYTFDLNTRTERRLTDNIDNQTFPTVSGNLVVWVDQRNQNRDLYSFDLDTGFTRRLTYSATDEAQPVLSGDRVVYTDFAAGLGDPGIGLYQPTTRRNFSLTPDEARQEEPTTDGDTIAWQDNRTGRWQIRTAEFAPNTLRLTTPLAPGYNLVAVTQSQADATPSAFALLTEWNAQLPISEIQSHDPVTGAVRAARWNGGTPDGDDFAVIAGTAVVALSDVNGDLDLGDLVACPEMTLATGVNYVGFSCVPPGFTAKDMFEALGLANASAISRFDNRAGVWETLAEDAGELSGKSFEFKPGDGLLIYARDAVPAVIP